MNIDQYISDVVNGYSELLARRENAKIMSDKELPMSVTVEEAKKMKGQLEQQIASAVTEFTDTTGLVVVNIYIDHVNASGYGNERETFYGKARVELRL